MSDEMLPPAPPAPLPPTPAAKGIRKHHLGMILGGAFVIFLIMRMMSGSSSASTTATTSADPSTTAAADSSAAAPAAAPTAPSGNPLIGNWTLIDTDKTYCGTHEEFKADSTVEVKAGVTTTYPAIYLIKQGYVDVATGNVTNYDQWDETGPDEITLRINSLYVVASCAYHRD
jgi:hypothetical protein